MRGKLAKSDTVAYMVAQVAGATAAGATAAWIFDENVVPCLADKTMNGWAKAATCETLFTFALCLVVLNVATTASQGDNHFFGLAIGITVSAGAVSVGPISGGGFNPAVGLGLWLAKGLMVGEWSDCVYLYLTAPFVGALLAALVFKLTVPPSEFK